MRILHVTDTSIYNYDGISTYINEILEVSENQGHTSLVLTNKPFGKKHREFGMRENTKIHLFKCFRFPGKPSFVITYPVGINKIIEDFNPDLIWIHTIGTLGTKAARIAQNRYKVIYTKHCFDGELWNAYLRIPKYFHWFFNYAAQHFENKILKVSKKVVYHLNDISKVKSSPYFHKFITVSPPLNARFFEGKPLKQNNPKTLTFGFCGRAEPDKGIENTFRGLSLLKEKYKFSDFRFVFIGDGSEAHRMKEMYADIDIKITGYVNDVIPYLDSLDAMVISSLQETISLSSLETYARGVSIVSLPIGYLYEHKEKLSNYYVFHSTDEMASHLYQHVVMAKKTTANTDIRSISDFLIDYPGLLAIATAKNETAFTFIPLRLGDIRFEIDNKPITQQVGI